MRKLIRQDIPSDNRDTSVIASKITKMANFAVVDVLPEWETSRTVVHYSTIAHQVFPVLMVVSCKLSSFS